MLLKQNIGLLRTATGQNKWPCKKIPTDIKMNQKTAYPLNFTTKKEAYANIFV